MIRSLTTPLPTPIPSLFGTDEHHGDVSPPPAQLPKPEASRTGPTTPHADEPRVTFRHRNDCKGITQLCSHPFNPRISMSAAIGVPGPASDVIHRRPLLLGLLVSGRATTPDGSADWVRRTREWGFVHSPSYWWPDDHAWVAHSEADHDSTLLGCSREPGDVLLADQRIECLRAGRETSLFANADRVNQP